MKIPAPVAAARDQALDSPVHDERTASILGIGLGVAFTTCFLTGIYSHLLQHPVSWLAVPSRPAGLYRITQGLHVATGTAAIPLLLAKLWSVYPHLFQWPPVKNISHGIERLLLVPLVGAAVLQLFTGYANVARWYPWPWFFPTAHFWLAWVAMGAIVAHIAAKASTTRRALRHRLGPDAHVLPSAAPAPGTLGRRGFLGAVAAAVGIVTVTTVGQTIGPLRRLVLLGPRRPDIGPQGVPVNRSAVEAGVRDAATSPTYTLTINGTVPTPVTFTLAELEAMPRVVATLPIACVEGWSASATWRGVRVRDLLRLAGVPEGRRPTVDVVSLEQGGLYSRSVLNPSQANDADTLLAFELDGARIDLDHGYPVRLIGPNRAGVMQTKWVRELVVR
jgi:hypothetical protein